MSKNNNRTEQQQVDVFDTNSAEDTKDNIVPEEKELKKKRRQELEKTMSSIKWANDPLDW